MAAISSDPYLASALEFMYSEDSQSDKVDGFASMNRAQQEKILQASWAAREREFYGDDEEGDAKKRKTIRSKARSGTGLNFSISE